MNITTPLSILILVGLAVLVGAVIFSQRNEFALPQGATTVVRSAGGPGGAFGDAAVSEEADTNTVPSAPLASSRTILETGGVKHSVPLNEILSGGPGKDGIPSIDDPKFISAKTAGASLNDSDPGLGLTVNGESRFYPYRILVWHEIVNDTIAGKPVLVTYCPLCATGIVFDRKVGSEAQEFGVSGRLWQSNLLMYNRAGSSDSESLWSQVLGEAVVGPNTGERLRVIPSDIARWGAWRAAHPDTVVLSEDTGAARSYGRDPYGDYYTSESVSFGATFTDTRLHPKALVHGIEVDGRFKAYEDEALKRVSRLEDSFAGASVVATVNESGAVRFEKDGEPLASIPGFWFSWLAVHPETELYK